MRIGEGQVLSEEIFQQEIETTHIVTWQTKNYLEVEAM